LASDVISLERGFANYDAGKAVIFSCIGEIWGREISDSVLDFLIEYARTAFGHGNATTVKIKFESKRIVVTDDGERADLNALAMPSSGRGGGLAYRELLAKLHVSVISSSRDSSGENIFHLPLIKNSMELATQNPGALNVSFEHLRNHTFDFWLIANCDWAYFVAPDLMSYSDSPDCELMMEEPMNAHKNVVLVIPNASAAVLSVYRQRFGIAKVLSL
jgi:hypothetical protein